MTLDKQILDKPITVAVCGGGISGLTFAIAMAKNPNVSVEIYESASEFSPIGAGIGIWMRVWDILVELGLADELKTKTASTTEREPVHALTFRKSDQEVGLEFYTLITQGPFITFHRNDFQQTLLKHLPPSCKLNYSKRLSSYTTAPNGKITVSFHDGTRSTCDLLIGADGIKSAVRYNFLRRKAALLASLGRCDEGNKILSTCAPSWTGTVAYRALIPVDKVQKQLDAGILKVPEFPTQHMGKNANLIIYPVANGSMINFAAFHHQPDRVGTLFEGPWVSQVEKGDLQSIYSGWEPQVQAWLEFVESPTRWAIHTVQPLDSFASDGVVLVGDAAHAMVPHQGSGAGQAIEDAYFLATLLNNPSITRRDIPKVLSVYDAIRRPFANEVCRKSYLNGAFYTLNHPEFGPKIGRCKSSAEQEVILKQMGEALNDNWEWTWTTLFKDTMDAGNAMLKEMMVLEPAFVGGAVL